MPSSRSLPFRYKIFAEFCTTQTEKMRMIPILTTFSAAVFGFLIGISFPVDIIPKFPSSIFSCSGGDHTNASFRVKSILGISWASLGNKMMGSSIIDSNGTLRIYVPTNPRGAENLPPGIVVSESDLYLHRLWRDPSEDLSSKHKYLLTLAVCYKQKDNVNATVHKFSENFAIMLFHYDGRTSEWDEFEWSKQAIHVSSRKQTKWWFAKRFLHPDIVAPYEYIFIWDEDLGVENFSAEEYIELVKKHGLEISQPGLDPTRGNRTYDVTIRREGSEIHKGGTESTGKQLSFLRKSLISTEGRPSNCTEPHRPPCSGFVEIMAPVFSRDAWRCVWHMIQNDLVHGWGLDFTLGKCVENPEENIGVVDAQWIVHQGVPTLRDQGKAGDGSTSKVEDRQWDEWETFKARMANAERAYFKNMGITLPNSTSPLTH